MKASGSGWGRGEEAGSAAAATPGAQAHSGGANWGGANRAGGGVELSEKLDDRLCTSFGRVLATRMGEDFPE